jgi:hypothetical protein
MIAGVAATIFFITFIILFILVCIYLWMVWKIERMLEKQYQNVWLELGSPHLITNNSLRNNLKLIRFLRNKEYKKLEDRELTKKASFCYRLYVFLLIALLVMITANLSIFIF